MRTRQKTSAQNDTEGASKSAPAEAPSTSGNYNEVFHPNKDFWAHDPHVGVLVQEIYHAPQSVIAYERIRIQNQDVIAPASSQGTVIRGSQT